MMAPARLLVIDDSDSLRAVVRLTLQVDSPDVAVREAATAEEGLAIARAWRPDAVVLDCYLPGMSGLEVLPRLKRELPDAQIVMFSSGYYAATAPEAHAGGAACYIEKSEGPLRLLEVLTGPPSAPTH